VLFKISPVCSGTELSSGIFTFCYLWPSRVWFHSATNNFPALKLAAVSHRSVRTLWTMFGIILWFVFRCFDNSAALSAGDPFLVNVARFQGRPLLPLLCQRLVLVSRGSVLTLGPAVIGSHGCVVSRECWVCVFFSSVLNTRRSCPFKCRKLK